MTGVDSVKYARGGEPLKRALPAAAAMLLLLAAGCTRTRPPAAATTSPAEAASSATIAPQGTPPPTPTPAPYVHIVEPGDTLEYIASKLGCPAIDIVFANDLPNPDSLQVGQRLVVPSLTLETGPDELLLPDSEFVYGPAYLDFDVDSFCATRPGYLNSYEELVDGETLRGPEIVALLARRYSVGPRLLLAMIEFKSGWVNNPTPAAVDYPLGRTEEQQSGLLYQLAWAADQLNQGYYDWKGRGRQVISLSGGSRAQYDPGLNAATAAVQRFLAFETSFDEWQTACGDGPDSFAATYQRLFGDPFDRSLDPVVPPDVEVPELRLPWESGHTWYLTGGPHGAWNDGSAWAALDFAPPGGHMGCQMADGWLVAAASALVVRSEKGAVLLDLDGDGHEESGWNLFYMHVAAEGRVSAGTQLKEGQRVGHASCEGGYSTATHLHFARKYNGEWIPADGPLPMVLSGWRAHAIDDYEGTMTKGDLVRTACECWEDDHNGLTAD